ncbi:MAG: hypothetical protein LBR91_02790 [Puniceicoccales bacterium]|jgi:hypothetical protein|nr:hypothetical protein [Puniceicoccales bacterium]
MEPNTTIILQNVSTIGIDDAVLYGNVTDPVRRNFIAKKISVFSNSKGDIILESFRTIFRTDKPSEDAPEGTMELPTVRNLIRVIALLSERRSEYVRKWLGEAVTESSRPISDNLGVWVQER